MTDTIRLFKFSKIVENAIPNHIYTLCNIKYSIVHTPLPPKSLNFVWTVPVPHDIHHYVHLGSIHEVLAFVVQSKSTTARSSAFCRKHTIINKTNIHLCHRSDKSRIISLTNNLSKQINE